MTQPSARLFSYQGKNRKGLSVQGILKAQNIHWARHQLRKKGIRIQSLKKHWAFPFIGNNKIKPKEIALFTQQLSLLLKVGIPIRKSFDILANSFSNSALKQIIHDLNNGIYSGDSLAKSLRNHPKYFSGVFCNMVEAGEESGTLTLILERLAHYQEQTELFKRRAKKALTYPIIVLIIALLVASIMLTQVIPSFAKTYSEFSTELPAFTLFVIDLSNSFSRLWPFILAGVLACYTSCAILIKRSIVFSKMMDRAVLKLPWLGALIKKVMLGRLTRTLAITITAGLPIVDALKSSASSIENSCYTDAIQRVREDVIGGLSLHRALGKQSIFPVTLEQMVDVGEESGSLTPILERAGQIYERDVELALDTIIPLIEPVMMITLGLLVGGLLLAMYLPVFQLGHIF